MSVVNKNLPIGAMRETFLDACRNRMKASFNRDPTGSELTRVWMFRRSLPVGSRLNECAEPLCQKDRPSQRRPAVEREGVGNVFRPTNFAEGKTSGRKTLPTPSA